MAVSNFSGLVIPHPQVGTQLTKVTDTSADWPSVANDTYFYDKATNVVYYKNPLSGIIPLFQDLAFSPINIGSADTAPTAATTQYYYQTVSEVTKTISRAKIWGFSGTDNVLFGIYRGRLNSTMTLIGQGSATCTVGPNIISIIPEVGQNLNLVDGEDIVVGFYPNGTSFRTLYRSGISDLNYGISNTANITTMPASPTGTGTDVRFALTLY